MFVYVMKGLSALFQKIIIIFSSDPHSYIFLPLKMAYYMSFKMSLHGMLLVEIVTKDLSPCSSKYDFWIPHPKKGGHFQSYRDKTFLKISVLVVWVMSDFTVTDSEN